jgi:nucleoside phosphorylase
VVLTALDLEYDAVRRFLTDLRTQTHPSGTVFEIGTVRGTDVRVALAVGGVGSRATAVLVERANTTFKPNSVLLVGIAGAVHSDLSLGDVVVATKVYSYEGGKEQGTEFLARPRAWDAPHHLEQQARHLLRTSWLSEHTGPAPFGVHLRPIAVGEVLVDSDRSAIKERIRQHYNDVAAIEMEGSGAAEAGHLNRSLPVLVIRGISDRADGTKLATDAAGRQGDAAAHAAAFAMALVVNIATDHHPVQTSTGLPVRPVPARRRRLAWLLGALAIVGATAGGVILLNQTDRRPPAALSPSSPSGTAGPVATWRGTVEIAPDGVTTIGGTPGPLGARDLRYIDDARLQSANGIRRWVGTDLARRDDCAGLLREAAREEHSPTMGLTYCLTTGTGATGSCTVTDIATDVLTADCTVWRRVA